MPRLTAPLSVLGVLCAFAVSGCGGGGASDPLDEALGYLPRDATFAVAVDTNLRGGQYKALGRILDKFPFGEEIKRSLRRSIEEDGNVDFERDVKPLLGNPFVVGTPDARGLVRGGDEDFVGAIRAKNEGKLNDLVERSNAKEQGEEKGAKIYRSSDGDTFAVKDDVLVVAATRKLVEKALDQRGRDDRLREDAFDDALAGLPRKALVRVYGDLQALIRGDPDARDARKVRWVRALRTLGLTASVKESEVAVDFHARTDADQLSDSDLPIASGAAAPAVLERPREITVGLRDPRQIYRFALRVAQTVDPAGFGRFELAKRQIEQRLGVSIDHDVVGQLSGDVSVNASVDGKFGLRAKLKDPVAFRRTLRRLATVLPSFAEGAGLGKAELTAPSGGRGLYRLTRPGGETVVFGVVGDALVASNDPRRAGRLGAGSPRRVPGARGSIVLSANAKQLVDQLLTRVGGVAGLSSTLLAGPLGDLTGSVSADREGLKGKLALAIE